MKLIIFLRLIELETKYDNELWRNIYSSDYIEEITSKTGNRKKFNVFIQMLT